jgi:tryptophanyl-tRNA synthetase
MEDDNELKEINEKYSKGLLMTSDVKKKLCDVLIPIIEQFQYNRKLVTDEVLDSYLKVRPLQFY